jgi:hypothetical protein
MERVFYSHWDTLMNNSKEKGELSKKECHTSQDEFFYRGLVWSYGIVTEKTGDNKNIIYMKDFFPVVGVEGGVSEVELLLFTWRTLSRSC